MQEYFSKLKLLIFTIPGGLGGNFLFGEDKFKFTTIAILQKCEQNFEQKIRNIFELFNNSSI